MDSLDGIEGYNVRFRFVQPEDAAYIHSLRHSQEYGRYLSPPTPTVEGQQKWIAAYKIREALGQEYYFIIERLVDRVQCGTIRLYNIAEDSLTWGSWILDANKPTKAALDSVLLAYKIAFNHLGCRTAFVDVRAENIRSLNFQRRFGTVETHSDELNIYFRMAAVDFAKRLSSLEGVFFSPDQEQSRLPSKEARPDGS